MRFAAALLMTLSLGLVSPAAAQSKFSTVSVNMALDLPVPTNAVAPSANYLKYTLNPAQGGQSVASSKISTGSGVTSFLIEIHPTSGLIVRGMRQISSSSTTTNFDFTGLPFSYKVECRNMGGAADTPSGILEPVTGGNSFDATKHRTIFNQGTVTTKNGSGVVQETSNLATTPLYYLGVGTGTIAVSQTGKSGFNRTYSIKVTQPLNSFSTQPVKPDGTTMKVEGSIVGTGSVTVEVKPALEVQPPVVGVGVPVKIKGINGELVKLMAGDTPSTITRWVNDSTYTIGAVTANEVTVTDAGALGKAKQFYAVVPGP